MKSPPPNSFIPATSPTAAVLRTEDPDKLVGELNLDTARKIISEWRGARLQPGAAKPNAKTAALYQANSRMLELKYSAENNADGIISPVDIILGFFKHSRSLSYTTWRLYRSGLVYTMDERARELEAAGIPHPTLIRALATLLIVAAKPYGADLLPPRSPSRGKSIKSRDFDRIITHLATNYAEKNQSARRAQSFAMATIATGLRPTEWVGAKLRDATIEEVPPGETNANWLAIEVDTAKRKLNEPDWKRTILLQPGIHQIHVRQHFTEMHAFLASNSGSVDPATNYCRRSSRALAQACKELWPDTTGGKAPVRITLYSLRHQARANVAAAYGGFVAAGMMGHSPHTGANAYTGKHRANWMSGPRRVKNLGVPVPVPGQDVLAKAREFEADPSQIPVGPEDDAEAESM